jgi:hypothetical protein
LSNTAIPTLPRGGNHTPAFAEAAASEEAHKATMTVTKGLAMTGFRVVADAAFCAEVCGPRSGKKKKSNLIVACLSYLSGERSF